MTRSRDLLAQLEDRGAGKLATERLAALLDLVEAADELHTDFQWGREAEEAIEVDAPHVAAPVLYRLGDLVEVAYQTQKGSDEIAIYVHEFRPSLPTLAATPEGELVIVGGDFRVTRRGIVG